jgi:plastocyanin
MVRRLGMGVALVLFAAGLTVPAHGDDASPVVTFGPAAEYFPATVHVAPGGSVTIKPASGVTFEDHPLVFVDGSVHKGTPDATPVVKTFPTAGRFEFYCSIHGDLNAQTGHVEGMSGVVNVTTNQLPIARFTAKANGQNVTFDASASSDPDGSITKYQWDFDDDGGIDLTTTSATTTRKLAKSSKVILTVTDNNADVVGPESTTVTQQVTVTDKTPPKVKVSSKSLKLSDLAAGRAKLSFTSSEPGSASATVKSGATTVATGKATIAGAGTVKLTLKPTAAGRRLKAGATLTLSLTVSDKAGNHSKTSVSVSAK